MVQGHFGKRSARYDSATHDAGESLCRHSKSGTIVTLVVTHSFCSKNKGMDSGRMTTERTMSRVIRENIFWRVYSVAARPRLTPAARYGPSFLLFPVEITVAHIEQMLRRSTNKQVHIQCFFTYIRWSNACEGGCA